MKLLRPDEVAQRLGITRAALASLRRRDDSFPTPIRISQKVLRWREEDVEGWLLMREEEDGETS